MFFVIVDFEFFFLYSDRILKGYRRCEEFLVLEFGCIDGVSLGVIVIKFLKLLILCCGKKSMLI